MALKGIDQNPVDPMPTLFEGDQLGEGLGGLFLRFHIENDPCDIGLMENVRRDNLNDHWPPQLTTGLQDLFFRPGKVMFGDSDPVVAEKAQCFRF
jgi:hypothetical protein